MRGVDAATAAAEAARAADACPNNASVGGTGLGGSGGGSSAASSASSGACPQHFAPFLLHYAHYTAIAADGKWQGFLPPGQRGTWHFAKADLRDAYPPHPFPRPPAGCGQRCEGVTEVLARIDAAAAALWAGDGVGATGVPAVAGGADAREIS